MIRNILIFFLMHHACSLIAQPNINWAGPDTITCGNKGVMLGVNTPCPDCCFTWSPSDGLSDANIQNPIARPQKETTYTVVVTDANLSWKKSDEVKVKLSFGEILFIPDHLEQGTDEIVLAKLQKNVGNFSTTWSFQGADLGCTIDPIQGDYNRATLSAGTEYGKLQVKVRKNTDTLCYFVATLPVNNGVKDLKVIDLNTPNRFAETGEILYLVSNNPIDWKARLIAIPNEGGFANGNPIYKQDLYGSPLPLSDEDDQIVEDIATPFGKHSDYLAGDSPDFEPRVKVIRKIPVETPGALPGLLTNLYNWWSDFESSLNFDDVDFNAPGTPPAGPCPDSDGLEFNANFGVVMKSIDVEKFASPDLGVKEECSIDVGVNILGKLFHPQFTRHFVVAGIGVCSELYASLELITTLHLGMSADESLQDAGWNLNDPQLEIALLAGVGFSATLLSGTGYNLQASGSGNLSCKGFIDYKRESRDIVATAKLLPLTIKLEAVVINETNMGEFEPLFNLFSKEVVLYKGLESPPFILHHFND